MNRIFRPTIVFALISLLGCFYAGAPANAAPRAGGSAFERGFAQPPESARPWVYWFWLNGNISSNGITADLEAMRRVGIGGVLIMEVDQGAPVGPIDYLSPQWRELFKHVVAEAWRLGLEVNMNDDAGWNGSGGPWIKPEQSMQKVVWTETNLEGPRPFEGALPQPKAVANFYRDIAVWAFPTPGAYRIPNLPVKAGYQVGYVPPEIAPTVPAEMAIDQARLVNLTAKMDKDGRLVWEAPPGKWTIMRFGHTSTGVENAPAPASGRGLECDKLSKEGIEAQFNGQMGKLIADVGPAAGKTLVTTHIDSWENGAQNWTARMREQFQARRGYDPLPYLPVLSGRVVRSLEVSERFLWDLRQTISDLVVEDYAGHMRELARRHGMRLSIEAYGGPCDDLPYAGRADEPMGEFWIGGGALSTCKEMASAAHTYGKPILGAESFTAADQERWLEHPATMKALGDRAFCLGVNRFVFHRYALQPWKDRRPGMTMGPWGVHYERTQTWWDWTRGWHEYLARCQFLLRQGHYVADLCYLQPEAAPQSFHEHNPRGYSYDNCSAEVVLTRMTVRDGRLVLPDGMSYRVLVLPEVKTMTPALLRQVKNLVEAGATVIGPRPLQSPSLAGYPECDREVQRLGGELWGDCDGKAVKEHHLGQGRIVWGLAPEQVLAQAGVGPDFTSSTRLNYIHRQAEGTDFYFVANPYPRDLQATCSFRAPGKRPELWWADTGRIEPTPMFSEHGGAVSLALTFPPSGSVFVVFRKTGPAIDPVVAVSRDGKNLLSLSDTAPNIIIDKATYGVPGDPQRSRDVRAKVQDLVNAGERRFQVARLAEGDDPAARVVKTLSVEYTLEGRHFTATGKDSDTVTLQAAAPHITVRKAVYGVLDDPKRTRDVRARVQHLVETGEASFQVARLAEGDDPAFLVVKTVVIEYDMEGKHLTATGTDPETIDLAVPDAAEKIVELHAQPDGSLRLEAWQPGQFEVTTASGRKRQWAAAPAALEIAGSWDVRFAPGWGAPAQATFAKLASWSENADPGVKYYSGVATYARRLDLPGDWFGANQRLVLDLGRVQVMARVELNGTDLGLLWKPPYQVDITSAAKPGDNTLVVRVVNLWPNRQIGDEQLPEDSDRNANGTLKQWPPWLLEDKPSPAARYTFTSWRLWKKPDALLPSGLLGPVSVRKVVSMPVQ
jgi:hypothetical protein